MEASSARARKVDDSTTDVVGLVELVVVGNVVVGLCHAFESATSIETSEPDGHVYIEHFAGRGHTLTVAPHLDLRESIGARDGRARR